MDLLVQWLITILFTVAIGGSLHRIWIDRSAVSRVGHAFHLVASLMMLAMTWPGAFGFSSTLQAALFGLASVWFAVRAMRSRYKAPAKGRSDTAGQSLVGIYHSFTMIAMSWMALSMAGHGTEGMDAHHSHSAPVAGSSSTTETAMTGHGHHHDESAWSSAASPGGEGSVSVVSVVIATIFGMAALVWLFRPPAAEEVSTRHPAALSKQPTPRLLKRLPSLTWETASEACMAAGMAIMIVLMA